MPNKSYLRGRRLEYALCKLGRDHGWKVARTAGSHGDFDVIWTRRNTECCGSVLEGLEQIRNDGWLPEPDSRKVPEQFTYGFFRFTRGLNKHWIWVEPVDGSLRQVVLVQCKTKLRKH